MLTLHHLNNFRSECIHSGPAYQAALSKGGVYAYA